MDKQLAANCYLLEQGKECRKTETVGSGIALGRVLNAVVRPFYGST